jgi:hypothetical protein
MCRLGDMNCDQVCLMSLLCDLMCVRRARVNRNVSQQRFLRKFYLPTLIHNMNLAVKPLFKVSASRLLLQSMVLAYQLSAAYSCGWCKLLLECDQSIIDVIFCVDHVEIASFNRGADFHKKLAFSSHRVRIFCSLESPVVKEIAVHRQLACIQLANRGCSSLDRAGQWFRGFNKFR